MRKKYKKIREIRNNGDNDVKSWRENTYSRLHSEWDFFFFKLFSDSFPRDCSSASLISLCGALPKNLPSRRPCSSSCARQSPSSVFLNCTPGRAKPWSQWRRSWGSARKRRVQQLCSPMGRNDDNCANPRRVWSTPPLGSQLASPCCDGKLEL